MKVGRRYEEIEAPLPSSNLCDAMGGHPVSVTEAVDCIKAIQEERGSGEAVQHFGGPLELKGAMRCRKVGETASGNKNGGKDVEHNPLAVWLHRARAEPEEKEEQQISLFSFAELRESTR